MIHQHVRGQATRNEGRWPAETALWRLMDRGRESLEEWLLWLVVQATYRTRWGASGYPGGTEPWRPLIELNREMAAVTPGITEKKPPQAAQLCPQDDPPAER